MAILVSFVLSIALFGALAAYLIHDDTKGASLTAIWKAPATAAETSTHRSISRIRRGVVAASFVIWSLMMSEHLRPRR